MSRRLVFLTIFLATDLAIASPEFESSVLSPDSRPEVAQACPILGLSSKALALKARIEAQTHREIPLESLPLLEDPAYAVVWLARKEGGIVPHIALFANTPGQQQYYSFDTSGLKKFQGDWKYYRSRRSISKWDYMPFAFPLFGINSQTLIRLFAECRDLYRLAEDTREHGVSVPTISEKELRFRLMGRREAPEALYSNCTSFVAMVLDKCIGVGPQRELFSARFRQSLDKQNLQVIEPEYFYSILVVTSLGRLYGVPTFDQAKADFKTIFDSFVLLHKIVPSGTAEIPRLTVRDPVEQLDPEIFTIINIDYGLMLGSMLTAPLSTFTDLPQIPEITYQETIFVLAEQLIGLIERMEIWSGPSKPRRILTRIDILTELRIMNKNDPSLLARRVTMNPTVPAFIACIIGNLPQYKGHKLAARIIMQEIEGIMKAKGDCSPQIQALKILCAQASQSDAKFTIWAQKIFNTIAVKNEYPKIALQ